MGDPGTDRGAADYWADSFAHFASRVAERTSSDPALASTLGRVLASGLPLYIKSQQVVARLGALVEATLVSPTHRGAWAAALRAEPLVRDELLPSLRAALLDCQEAVEEAPDDHAAVADFLPRFAAAVASLGELQPGPSALGSAAPTGHVRGVVRLAGATRFSVEDVLVEVGTEAALSRAQSSRVLAYAPSSRVIDDLLRTRLRLRIDDDEPVFVVKNVCVPASTEGIGAAETGEHGRSLDLGLLLAALGARDGWRFAHDRVVVSGRIDWDPAGTSACDVLGVDYVPEKVEAVRRWAVGLEIGSGPRPQLVLPSACRFEVMPRADLLEAAGVEVHLVASLEQALEVLRPHIAPSKPPSFVGLKALTATFAIVWWGERLFGGEYLTDGAVRARANFLGYMATSALPALLPTCAVLWLSFSAPLTKQGSAHYRMAFWRWGGGAAFGAGYGLMAAAGAAAFVLQAVAGGHEPIPATADFYRGVGTTRILNLWKDEGLIYPVAAMLLCVLPLQAHVARRLSTHLRSSARAFDDAGPALRALAAQARPRQRLLPLISLLILAVAIATLSKDFIDNFQRDAYGICAHIFVQSMIPVVYGLVLAQALLSDAEGHLST
jgi:hypothetical protein